MFEADLEVLTPVASPASGISPPFCNALYHSELMDFRFSAFVAVEVAFGLAMYRKKWNELVEKLKNSYVMFYMETPEIHRAFV